MKHLLQFLLCMIAFLAPFSVATTVSGIPLNSLSNLFTPLLILGYLIFNKAKIFNIRYTFFDFKILVILFFVPILTSLLSFVLNFFLINDVHFSILNLIDAFPRLFNYLCLFFILNIFVGNPEMYNMEDIAKGYYCALLIFLFFGLWQILNIYLNVPIVDFETRNHLHSVTSAIFSKRITSIAREPSFFAPLLAELFILTLYFKSKTNKTLLYSFFQVLIVLVTLLTLSPSAYIEFSILFFLIFIREKQPLYTKIGVLIIMVLGVCFIYDIIDQLILTRIENASDSGRFQQIAVLVSYMTNAGLNMLLFGVGPKGLSYLGSQSSINHITEIQASSNNIFVDLFVDSGLFGVVFLMIFFIYIIIRSYRVKCSNIPLYLAVHFFVCNMYRGMYSSSYFAVVLAIWMYLIRLHSSNRSNVS